jgi:hypothetical protein
MIRPICLALLLATPAFTQAPPMPPIPVIPRPTPIAPPLPLPTAPQPRVQVPVSIVDENGAGVAGATVAFTRVSGYGPARPGPRPRLERVTVQSGANGSAALPNGLVGEKYVVCVDAPLFLNSCVWGAATSFTVTAQSPAAKPISISIKRGAAVSVVVHDPQGKFPAANFVRGASRGFNVGVRTASGAFIPAGFAGQFGTDLQFQILVPAGVNLTLSFLCRQYDAVTDSGASLDVAGKGQQFILPNAATQAQFKLTLVAPTRPISAILGY